jgi:hypothetical protein
MEAPVHADEHPLPLAPSTIEELHAALEKAGPVPAIDRHSDFIVYPVPARPND